MGDSHNLKVNITLEYIKTFSNTSTVHFFLQTYKDENKTEHFLQLPLPDKLHPTKF